jgi:hypothetical protein
MIFTRKITTSLICMLKRTTIILITSKTTKKMTI